MHDIMRGRKDSMISSLSNSQIKEVVKLQKQSRYRKKSGCFVAEGFKLVIEAAERKKLKKIYLSESGRQKLSEVLSETLKNNEYELVTDDVFEQMSDTITPQGVLGIVEMPVYDIKNILSDYRKTWLLLDDLRDPGNLGTIMRTAEGAGMSGVIMSRECVDLFNPKTVRSTMGAIFRVPFYYTDSLRGTISDICSMGYGVYGTAMQGSVIYDEVDYTSGAAIVIGNEANGISEEVFAALTGRIRIPMEGQLESLNAAVSAAVVMYEAARQRRKQKLN